MNTIAIINIAKGQLAMAEDDYRAVLERVTGLTSLRAMTEAQKLAVIEEMKRLGFRVKAGGHKLPASVRPHVRLIHALWASCHRLGVIESRTPAALRAFWEKFRMAQEVNLDDPATQAGVQALEIAGLIGTGRAAVVLA